MLQIKLKRISLPKNEIILIKIHTLFTILPLGFEKVYLLVCVDAWLGSDPVANSVDPDSVDPDLELHCLDI